MLTQVRPIRSLFLALLFLISWNLFENSGLAKDKLDEYKKSWTYRALMLQQKLDIDAPLAEVMFPHTHNSYNSRAYAHPFRYVDPNHYESITTQLRMGIRSIEFDVHHYTKAAGLPWRKELLLCHARSNHVGCSIADRYFREGLLEVQRFLNDPLYRDEIVILYIEDHMDGQYEKAVRVVEETVGDLVFRPQASSPCQGIPMDLSKRQILASGRRLIIMGGSQVCSSHSGWNHLAFAGVGEYTSDSYPTASMDQYRRGECHEVFSEDFYQNHWVRVQEDRTNLRRVIGQPGDRLTTKDVKTLMSCRVNLIGLDKLKVADPRLESYIWSWDVNQPAKNSSHLCAAHGSTGRFHNHECQELRAFACKNTANKWYITKKQGAWHEGESTCDHETAGAYHFAVPVNGYMNEELHKLKIKQATEVWLNYYDATGQSTWEAGKI